MEVFIMLDNQEDQLLNKMYYEVGEFHKAFGHGVANSPIVMDEKTTNSRSRWIGEELVELLRATFPDENDFKMSYNHLIQGLDNAKEKELLIGSPKDKLVGQVDALIDILYFVMGSFVEMGVKPYQLFKIVHAANMGKLWPDGKPRYREIDGKIMKPVNWESDFAPEPKLREEIKRQIAEAV